jgi:hypothetical protein
MNMVQRIRLRRMIELAIVIGVVCYILVLAYNYECERLGTQVSEERSPR